MAEESLEKLPFKPGDIIFREGDKGYRAYIILEGDVDIVKEVDHKPTVVASVGKGGIIGEMALIDDSPRMASARGASDGMAIVVTADKFNAKLEKADPFVRGLLKILADHSRRLSKENVSLQSKLNILTPKT